MNVGFKKACGQSLSKKLTETILLLFSQTEITQVLALWTIKWPRKIKTQGVSIISVNPDLLILKDANIKVSN